ncbi:hypothetical protein [Flavobacterium sp.]|uniref:hypothetical protein n=1 Tax=Flavobacterium sp. TaxID=239 RepID=UPI0026051C08|nr:hypothetical protein [Flavobacterium sp.]MDD2987239.1 hypothetical protein [Flavobacterium sp.]
MKKKLLILSVLIYFTFFISCKNNYNAMLEWTETIEIGSDVQTVKNSQPDFIIISWENPIKNKNQILYEITQIDGNYDILNMSNFLLFIDNKYQGREARK